MKAERSCAITEEYAAYIIDLSFRLQEQLQEQLEQGNQDAAHRKARELNHIGYEIDRLSKLYPEFDKNSSVALFNNMWRFF